MIDVSPPAATGIDRRSARIALTEVELIWIEQRLEHRLRFGRVAAERILTPTIRILSFRPGAVFALVRRSLNDFGTAHSRVDIVRAVGPGEVWSTVPFVRPGGELLLSLQGWPKISALLAAIDGIEAGGVDPCAVAPDHWRHLHDRIGVGAPFRPYTAGRHAAWLKRKALGQ